MKTLYVVDDVDVNLSAAKNALKELYSVITLPSAEKMFAFLEKRVPDLILLDIEMPEMDGFAALDRLKRDPKYCDIPVIFLTGMDDEELEARGFGLGVIDFIKKPFSAPVLRNRIKTHLGIDDIIRERTAQLEERTRQIEQLQGAFISVLADMIENRDVDTGGHVGRTAEYLRILIDEMIAAGVYAEFVSARDRDLLVSSARLHDIGKIAISDVILNKPDKLNDDEFKIMKSHVAEGERIIEQITRQIGKVDFLENAMKFAAFHHERWDGNGYPHGKKGLDIPVQGRIMAVVDVYDALVSKRPYKEPFPHEKAVEIIAAGAGTQFDPTLVEIFLQVCDKFRAISSEGVER